MFQTDGKINICKDCFISNCINNETGVLNVDKFKATIMRCDYPWYVDNLKSSENQVIKENNSITEDNVRNFGSLIVKIYMKNVNTLRQLNSKSFADSEKDGFVQKNGTVIKREQVNQVISGEDVAEEQTPSNEVKWSKKDKQNMKYAISMVGYDPFEDVGLSEFDRKYCFNILAGYCDTPGVAEDGHKMQGVIEITMLYAQVRKITEAMNVELAKLDVDDAKVAKLTSSKSSLLSSINAIAKDNNIASNYNKNSRQGQSALTSKMKEMEELGFDDIKVNLFDIKTCDAFKQIAEISNQNIANQLTLDSNEYTDIIKEQREIIQKDTLEIDTLKEENRKLKNQIIDLENNRKR